MSYRPEYNVPHIHLDETISPDGLILTLRVGDFHSFLESLLDIKDGGQRIFQRQNYLRRLELRIVNIKNDVKKLGESDE